MAEILAEQVLSFTYDESAHAYKNDSNPSLFLPIAGETYHVVWNSIEYVSVAVADVENGMVRLGNQMPFGGEDTGEPFLMISVTDGSGMTIYTFDQGDTHTLYVYQNAEKPEETAGISIILYDRTGQAILKKGVKTLTTDTPTEGETALFTHGELLEGIEIDLSLAEGDQKVSVPDDYLVKEATIKKPANLLPEYIKKGIEIAGITGNFAGDVAEKTVELNMAEGDQVIAADEDTVLTKVTVIKPGTLLPENIVKDVNIGGVVGTYSGGQLDEILKHFLISIDSGNKKIIIYKILYDSYESGEAIVIPDMVNGFNIEVYAEGM